MFAQLTQKWVIINVVNLPDPDHQGPENMEMGQLLPNHQDEEEHQQQKEQDPVVPDHEHQHHVEIGFPVSNHREQQEQDPRETTL
jgi:hypothetical protein